MRAAGWAAGSWPRTVHHKEESENSWYTCFVVEDDQESKRLRRLHHAKASLL